MIKYITPLIILLGCNDKSKNIKTKKDFGSSLEELVLSEGKIGQTYFLKEPVDKGVLERKITYIGETQSSSAQFKILYSIIYSGLYDDSKRANSSIIFYSKEGRELGQFFISGVYNSVPTVDGSKLLIRNEVNNCNQITKINLKDSIPNEIFIHCKEENEKMLGDIYSFEKRK
ncbi:hypothetical protein U0D62_15775 [Aquimarina sp. 2201CG5-10]|nr:hypothetical protein [Aquimarina sp. 2201CG5-10]